MHIPTLNSQYFQTKHDSKYYFILSLLIVYFTWNDKILVFLVKKTIYSFNEKLIAIYLSMGDSIWELEN